MIDVGTASPSHHRTASSTCRSIRTVNGLLDKLYIKEFGHLLRKASLSMFYEHVCIFCDPLSKKRKTFVTFNRKSCYFSEDIRKLACKYRTVPKCVNKNVVKTLTLQQ